MKWFRSSSGKTERELPSEQIIDHHVGPGPHAPLLLANLRQS